MKNRFSKSLLVSVLSLVLCCAMLAGTTFAWFTDEVSGTGNRIKTGTLEIDVIANGDKLADGEDKPIFSYENWEPGYTAVATIEVVNNGSLAFDWRMVMTTDAVAGGCEPC